MGYSDSEGLGCPFATFTAHRTMTRAADPVFTGILLHVQLHQYCYLCYLQPVAMSRNAVRCVCNIVYQGASA